MGDLPGSSPAERASEDKARWKGSVLVYGGSRQIRALQFGIRATGLGGSLTVDYGHHEMLWMVKFK